VSTENTPTILIADDEPLNIQLASKPLRRQGYRLLTAPDGKQALERLRSEQVDLALLDVMMPYMTGFEVCRALKQNPKTADIPVLFITARTDLDSILEGFEAGAVDYLAKPWQEAEFLARVQTHLRLRQAEQEAWALNASKDKFISILAQELSGPFNGLKGVLKMLVEDFYRLEEAQRYEYLQLSYDSAESLHRLIQNLLIWANLHNDQAAFFPEEVDLGSLALDMVGQFQEEADQKRVQLQSHIPEGSFAKADPRMVQTVLGNLLTNGLMFTPEGGQVSLEAQLQGPWIQVTVWDTGIGIAPEDQKKLFRLDTQYKKKGTAGEMGTGMGLILCRELIEKNGGRIWLESEVGKGTRVSFTLPRSQSHVDIA